MSKQGIEYLHSRTKRRLDVFGAFLIGLTLSPVGAAAAAGVCIDTRNINPLFLQTRHGKHGEQFHTLKFRTLKRADEQGPLKILGTFDPRASKFGLFLRKYGIDEMPQIINILKGDMSLVGFRPSTAAALEDYEKSDPVIFNEWYECFTASRPGLVSTSSIYRHSIINTTPEVRRQSMRLDIADTENASLANDLRLLATTPLELVHANSHLAENVRQS
jgi:lipopolysaccharide/colanic/teichoic acid biosynthesis glycosyltransferase